MAGVRPLAKVSALAGAIAPQGATEDVERLCTGVMAAGCYITV